jgi:hypothetical protein
MKDNIKKEKSRKGGSAKNAEGRMAFLEHFSELRKR